MFLTSKLMSLKDSQPNFSKHVLDFFSTNLLVFNSQRSFFFLEKNTNTYNKKTLPIKFLSEINRFNKKSIRFKQDYNKVIRMDSDKDYYDLFYLYNSWVFLTCVFILDFSPVYESTTPLVRVSTFKVIFFKSASNYKKDRAFFVRGFLYLSQLKYLFKKLIKVKFRRRRRLVFFFFRDKKFFSFIKLRRRLIMYRKWRRWKLKSKRRIYKITLRSLLNNTRRKLHSLLFNNLNKKFFFLNDSFYKNNFLNYNLNLTPFNQLKLQSKFFIFKSLNVFKNKFFPKLFIFFSSQFLEKLTNRKIFFKIHTNVKPSFFEKLWINYFFKKFFFIQRQFKGVLHLKEFIYILFLCFKHKDLFFLKNWLINFLEKINLKKHKTFLKSFKKIALVLLNSSSSLLKVKGFFFDIRGKVGVSGNAKKRHFTIKYKCYSFTKISFRADQTKFIVRTNTGVLGATLVITY